MTVYPRSHESVSIGPPSAPSSSSTISTGLPAARDYLGHAAEDDRRERGPTLRPHHDEVDPVWRPRAGVRNGIRPARGRSTSSTALITLESPLRGFSHGPRTRSMRRDWTTSPTASGSSGRRNPAPPAGSEGVSSGWLMKTTTTTSSWATTGAGVSVARSSAAPPNPSSGPPQVPSAFIP